MTDRSTEALQILIGLAWSRDRKFEIDLVCEECCEECCQDIIDYICEEFGYSQEDFPILTTCPQCNGGQTIGDQICSMCGGAGNDLTPILQPWIDEEEEKC